MLGLSPSSVDRHSFRDLWIMLGAARDRDERAWQHTLAVCQAVYNWGGPRGPRFRPKPLNTMYDQAFNKARTIAGEVMSAATIAGILSTVSTRRDG